MGGLGSRTRNPSITDPYIHTTIMATTPQSWADVCKNSPKTQTQPQGRTQPQPPHHQWDLQCPRDMWDVPCATTMTPFKGNPTQPQRLRDVWDVAYATTMTPLKGNPTQPQRLNDMWDVAHATTMVASHNTTNTMTNTWIQPVCEKCGYNLDGGGLCGCSNAAW